MSRSISAAAMQEMLAQETEAVYLVALTLTPNDGSGAQRYVNDMQDLVYGGNTYTALPFEVTLPVDDESGGAVVDLRIDNINGNVINAVRGATSRPTVEFEVVRVKGATITSEVGPLNFAVRGVQYDTNVLHAKLAYEVDYLNEPAVQHSFDNTVAPGLF